MNYFLRHGQVLTEVLSLILWKFEILDISAKSSEKFTQKVRMLEFQKHNSESQNFRKSELPQNVRWLLSYDLRQRQVMGGLIL